MEYKTFPGKTYIITSPNGGTVYDADGRTLVTAEANEQKAFVATTGSVTVSDTDAVITEVFKGAPSALGLLGGGNSGGSGGGGIEGDYLLFDANGVVTGGRMENVTNTHRLFYASMKQKTFTVPLPKTQTVYQMFASSPSLTSWDMELPEVTEAHEMMASTGNLTEVDISLPKATSLGSLLGGSGVQRAKISLGVFNGYATICRGCKKLTYLHVIAPKWVNINQIAQNASSLSEFYWDGATVMHATLAFDGCVLNKESVLRLAEVAGDRTGTNAEIFTIGIQADLEGDEEVAAAIAAITAKNWNVSVQYN